MPRASRSERPKSDRRRGWWRRRRSCERSITFACSNVSRPDQPIRAHRRRLPSPLAATSAASSTCRGGCSTEATSPVGAAASRDRVRRTRSSEAIRSTTEADRELFLARRDGAVVGRIAAIENRAHNRFHGDRVGFWGFFECIDDQAVADALFDAAARLARRARAGRDARADEPEHELRVRAADRRLRAPAVVHDDVEPALLRDALRPAGHAQGEGSRRLLHPDGRPAWSLPAGVRAARRAGRCGGAA